jgi:hypothetical protein
MAFTLGPRLAELPLSGMMSEVLVKLTLVLKAPQGVTEPLTMDLSDISGVGGAVHNEKHSTVHVLSTLFSLKPQSQALGPEIQCGPLVTGMLESDLGSNSVPLPTSCVTLGKSPGLSETQFTILSNDHSNTVHLFIFVRIKEISVPLPQPRTVPRTSNNKDSFYC